MSLADDKTKITGHTFIFTYTGGGGGFLNFLALCLSELTWATLNRNLTQVQPLGCKRLLNRLCCGFLLNVTGMDVLTQQLRGVMRQLEGSWTEWQDPKRLMGFQWG